LRGAVAGFVVLIAEEWSSLAERRKRSGNAPENAPVRLDTLGPG
jgi:hypothetical protein